MLVTRRLTGGVAGTEAAVERMVGWLLGGDTPSAVAALMVKKYRVEARRARTV
jgi:hypothetical protein